MKTILKSERILWNGQWQSGAMIIEAGKLTGFTQDPQLLAEAVDYGQSADYPGHLRHPQSRHARLRLIRTGQRGSAGAETDRPALSEGFGFPGCHQHFPNLRSFHDPQRQRSGGRGQRRRGHRRYPQRRSMAEPGRGERNPHRLAGGIAGHGEADGRRRSGQIEAGRAGSGNSGHRSDHRLFPVRGRDAGLRSQRLHV